MVRLFPLRLPKWQLFSSLHSQSLLRRHEADECLSFFHRKPKFESSLLKSVDSLSDSTLQMCSSTVSM